jgi:acetyltransferase-like isoleucine patch superfamily enzyme
VKSIFKNPITMWLRWLLVKYLTEFRHAEKHLQIRYLAYFVDCKFGNYNTLYENARLAHVRLGDFSYVAENSRITNATIGKFCSIGFDVIIGTGMHPSKTFVSSHPVFYSPLGQTQKILTQSMKE